MKRLNISLPKKQKALQIASHLDAKKDFLETYKKNIIQIGWPKKETPAFQHLARKNTIAILGVALGDEGKGRIVDNKVKSLLKKPGVKKVFVVRYQGGNNAGHTVEKGSIKLALHLIPSGVMYKKAFCVMDRGMVIHVEDLQTEVNYVEEKVGSLRGRLFLSDNATLATDLERAEEILNREKTGKAKGGTGRGIGPAYAHSLDRLGLKIYDLLKENWEETFSTYYNRYEKEFQAFNTKLKSIEIPDFRKTITTGRDTKRTVGSKEEFLERLKKSRSWLLNKNIVCNTFLLYKTLFYSLSVAFVFEGAQAAGLDRELGTHPDVTASNTTGYGILGGTGFWRLQDIEERIGVFKATYTSSVGERRMPTHIDLPKDLKDLPQDLSSDQKWGAFVREFAHEYGTTTGRPRDITYLDLSFLTYNAVVSGVEMLAGTHLDVAKENNPIKVCTHYTNVKGELVPYQPGLRHQEGIIPQYIELPGWDGKKCLKAKSMKQLPINALRFLSFIQARTGFPIVMATTGAKRDNFIEFKTSNYS